METVKINLNSLAPDVVSQGLDYKINLDASDLETLSGHDLSTGLETLGVKVEETSFLATSEDTFGLPIIETSIETSNELFATTNSEETFPFEGSGFIFTEVTSEEPSGDLFSRDPFKDPTILAASEEVSDPTFVTHAFNQKLTQSRKKGKSKEEKLEEKRTLRAKKELENSLKVPGVFLSPVPYT